ELHQPATTNLLRILFFIVPPTRGQQNPKSESTEQHKNQHANLAGIHRAPGQASERSQNEERDNLALHASNLHKTRFPDYNSGLLSLKSFNWCTGKDSNLRSS
ncbi:hypothetical protein, partial [Acidobacterium sp. S8]|uniref:hypothetical protein n=1 Tax=Acidobacterium sp. S8 TaxID=1641854 RepID=UPI001C20C072